MSVSVAFSLLVLLAAAGTARADSFCMGKWKVINSPTPRVNDDRQFMDTTRFPISPSSPAITQTYSYNLLHYNDRVLMSGDPEGPWFEVDESKGLNNYYNTVTGEMKVYLKFFAFHNSTKVIGTGVLTSQNVKLVNEPMSMGGFDTKTKNYVNDYPLNFVVGRNASDNNALIRGTGYFSRYVNADFYLTTNMIYNSAAQAIADGVNVGGNLFNFINHQYPLKVHFDASMPQYPMHGGATTTTMPMPPYKFTPIANRLMQNPVVPLQSPPDGKWYMTMWGSTNFNYTNDSWPVLDPTRTTGMDFRFTFSDCVSDLIPSCPADCSSSVLTYTVTQSTTTKTAVSAGSASSKCATLEFGSDEKTKTDLVAYWNRVAVDASGLDHTPPSNGDMRVWMQQMGPGRASRAMAIVHIAMFDAVNAIERKYTPYCANLPSAPSTASVDAAMAQAAHDTLSAMFTAQVSNFDLRLQNALTAIPSGSARDAGVAIGKAAAACILALRTGDGSEVHDPTLGITWNTTNLPGHWQQDPISQKTTVTGAFWGNVKPFSMLSGSQFRPPPPPPLSSPEYASNFSEAVRLGGDGVQTPTERTAEQEMIGLFWAYDGTPSLCAPPRLYNQMATQIAFFQKLSYLPLLRLLTLLNVAMADSGIGGWEAKMYYDFWRPITAIRNADTDGNPLTDKDPSFLPYGTPSGQSTIPNFTPPFPSYPSGHATFGGTLFQTLRNFFGTDNIPFTFISDELNGNTVGYIDGSVGRRPLAPRSYSTLSQAEQENGDSRVYLGIHYPFDKTAGIVQGNSIADWVYSHLFRPL